MFGEVQQCLYFRSSTVELLEGRIQLGGDVTNKLSLQCVVLVCLTDGFLLLTGQGDETEEYDRTYSQRRSQCGSQNTESDDDQLT